MLVCHSDNVSYGGKIYNRGDKEDDPQREAAIKANRWVYKNFTPATHPADTAVPTTPTVPPSPAVAPRVAAGSGIETS